MEEKEREEDNKGQKIWSWGAGTDAQLATSSLQDHLFPQLLTHFNSFITPQISFLSCGGAHVLALSSGGKVMSWGRGDCGQLGHTDIVPHCLYPKLVPSLSSFNISHVSAGWNHSAFVSDSGCLFTCGDGSFGQLGHGDNQSYSFPKEVAFFSSMHVQQIACGMRHSLVLVRGTGDSGDRVYGCGSGKRGQLGVSQEKIKSCSLPQPCSELEGSELLSITANGDHSTALSADGQLYTWGRGFSSGSDVLVPQSLPSSSRFKQVALGWNHALLLTDEQEVFMLGGSHHGVLSEPQKIIHTRNPSDSGNPTLSKVTGFDGKQVVQVAAGAEHSAVVTEDGQVWTWGWGEHGQLGLGNTSDHTLPQLVELGHHCSDNNHFTLRVYCGSGFTFAIQTLNNASSG